jgi:hypothetical protein
VNGSHGTDDWCDQSSEQGDSFGPLAIGEEIDPAASVGGKVDEFFFAFGSTDVFVIADFPDNVSAAALALAVTGGGGAMVRTVVLLTTAEVDQAAGRTVSYRPPGS